MRHWGWLLAAAVGLAACGPRSQVRTEEAVDYRAYRHFGVAPFLDPKGRGQELTDAFAAALAQATYEPVDQKALAAILAQYKPDREVGYRAEELEILRSRTGADALVLGRMAPDWSSAVVTVVELNSGASILHALLRPKGGQKAFAAAPDVAREFVRVYAKLR